MAIKKSKISNTKIHTLKAKSESNNLGVFKSILVLALIALQLAFIILSSVYVVSGFQYYTIFAGVLSLVACVHVLSTKSNGQTKATWVLFLLCCYSFGYVIYFLSSEKVLFGKSRKKYQKIHQKTDIFFKNDANFDTLGVDVRANAKYLYNSKFQPFCNSHTTYFPSGTQFFDDLIQSLKNAKKFIFMEFYIISNGVLLNRLTDVLYQKVKEGVEVRIIYDDLGCHGKLKRKTKKEFIKNGIKIHHFNKLLPIFNIALNLRNHRKIVIIDGSVAYTGGCNIADEYINEKQIFGYWKDSAIKVCGKACDNFTISFLHQWAFLTKTDPQYKDYLNIAAEGNFNHVVVPFVSGPEYDYSIARDFYTALISSAEERLYIMTPYFIPEETIINLLIAKAKSGIDVKIILPGVADKKMVYVVSRDYAERLISSGVKVYTMNNSFVHSKVICTEHSAVVGSINIDLRSFYQQFESAIYTNQQSTLDAILLDFKNTLKHSTQITKSLRKRNKFWYRVFASILRLISPLM